MTMIQAQEIKYEGLNVPCEDLTEYSICCGAEILHGTFCSECKEHCEPMEEED